jgi:hypothetical protein
MAQQSPWQASLNGLDNSATALSNRGQDQMNFLRDYYQKQYAPAMGPMAVTPAQSAPPAATPNTAAGVARDTIYGSSQTQDWMKFIANLFKPTATAAPEAAK